MKDTTRKPRKWWAYVEDTTGEIAFGQPIDQKPHEPREDHELVVVIEQEERDERKLI